MEKYYTEADAGSVRIGNENFTVLIPNGWGDCRTSVTILDKNEKVVKDTKFFTSFEGQNIKIYKYDCGGDEYVTILSGRFGAYIGNKSIWLARWE